MLKNLKLILDKKDTNKVIFIFFLNCLVAVLEFCSIGSIPILANVVINYETFLSNISNENIKILFSSYSLNEIIIFSFLIVVLLFFLKNILLFSIIYFEQKFYKGLNYKLSKKFFDYYVNSKYEFHVKNKPSELASNIDNETIYAVALVNYIGLLFRDSLVVLVIAGLLLYVNFFVTLTISSVFIVTLFFYYSLIKPKLHIKSKKNVVLREEIIKLLNETFGSIKELKVFKKTHSLQKLYNAKINEFQKNEFFIQVVNKTPRLVFEVVAIMFLLILFLYLVLQSYDFNSSIPIFSLLIVSFVRLIPAFNSIATSLNYIKICNPSLSKISKGIQEMTTNKDTEINSQEKKRESFYDKEKSIVFKNINFKYPNNNHDILKNLSIDIRSKDHIGIIGNTGSGKSTFINLMLGLLKPTSGMISIGNKKNINFLSDYINIGYISQNIFLLNTSIKENILFNFGDSNAEKVDTQFYKKVLSVTNLNDFIEKFPSKDDTIIGDNAINVSGGQKQRIALARAILNQPDILILDEATNALDYETEDTIMKNLSEIFKDKILIIVGHRPGTLKKCKKIYKLESGNLHHIGNYSEFSEIRNRELND
tara:strand:- start:766 stop:2550 length:1785 start_codon:yes stop_codon:yes gene_type:complete